MPYRIFAGTQDNAALVGPSDATLDDAIPDPWRSVYLDRWTGGDSFVTLPDPTDERFVYYEHQNGALMRMDTTGSSILSGGPSSESLRPRLPGLRFSWYTPFFISPHNPRTLYLSFTGFRENDTRPYVFVSTDTGRTWRSIASNLPPECVNVIKEDPTDPKLLYVGTDLGVYLSRDAGQSWESLSATRCLDSGSRSDPQADQRAALSLPDPRHHPRPLPLG
ncbi:WD40/YVTN/BNR-like repeat-containing protein [Armatimonas sp.]|uniref:WD40/YVTN/BNR-like repeat-containing protein n=1 Tax=Armatimonas sp. TaxID=1872638 RepID=UPI003752355D